MVGSCLLIESSRRLEQIVLLVADHENPAPIVRHLCHLAHTFVGQGVKRALEQRHLVLIRFYIFSSNSVESARHYDSYAYYY